MKKLSFIFLALAFLLSFGFIACNKSTFVPETPVNPEAPDDPGVYEEGLYVTVNGAGLFTGEDWDNAMSAQNLKNLLLADASGVFTAEQAAQINGKIIHLEQGIYSFGSAEQPLPLISGETASFSVTLKGGYKNGGYTQYPEKYHTYLSGGSDYQIFKMNGNVTLTLDGVGLTGARGEGGGKAAVIVDGGKLTMSRADITNNYNSYTTGAIQVGTATFTATNCRFFNNVASNAAAINLGGVNSQCILNDCEFFNNGVTQKGAAIKLTNGSLTAKNCNFHHNHAEERGGVVWVAGSKDKNSVLFESCTFANNSCTSGGGVCWQDGGSGVIFKDCDFTNNYASNGSAGTLYAAEAAEGESWSEPNQMVVTACRFSGNNSVTYNGGSIHVRGNSNGNSVFTCTDSSFDGEFTTASGGLVAVGGSGSPLVTFNRCRISRCSADKNSGVFYNYATSGRLYFNACIFEKNHLTKGNYGTEGVANTEGAFVGFNNCSMAAGYIDRIGANSQQSCWYNLNTGKIIFSNCSLVGTPTSLDQELPSYGLVRLNGDKANVRFVNNIIVSNNESGCSLFGGDTQKNLTVTGSYNKLSPVRTQKEGTFSYQSGTGDKLTEYASSFPGMQWSKDGWMWSGTYSDVASFAQTTAVNTAIQVFDADFCTWLGEIGALGKDIRGQERGTTSWPGSYQN